MEILTAQQVRLAEELGAKSGMSFARMMENAGSAAAKAIRLLVDKPNAHIVVLCGKGNNGGDGAVVARRLAEKGYSVAVVWLCGRPTASPAAEMAERLQGLGLSQADFPQGEQQVYRWIQSCDLVVDGVFGIGFHGQLPDTVRQVFAWCHAAHKPIVALDVPSGANSDSGQVAVGTPECVATVGFHSYKFAHILYPAAHVCGQVTVADIGLPQQASPSPFVITKEVVAPLLARKEGDTHKGTFGKSVLLVGSEGMAGAATLAVSGCLRCGVGLAYPVVERSIYPLVAAAAPEGVYRLYDADDSAAKILSLCPQGDSMLVGCGLGVTPRTKELCRELTRSFEGTLILDADGINCMAGHIDEVKERKGPTILTPHPMEMGRLIGKDAHYVQANRFAVATRFAKEQGVVVVLKGAGTIVAAPDGRVAVNLSGNSGLSKGGSGDLLAGMIASLTAQGLPAFEGALAGVWLHGTAGDLAAKRFSRRGMLPSDVAGELPRLFLEFEE